MRDSLKPCILVLIGAVALSLPSYSGESEHVADEPNSEAAIPNKTLINITINPESRVSVTLGRVQQLLLPRGSPVEIMVRVVNQGFVTGRLEAQLVGDPPANATLDFHPEPLKGLPLEIRSLHITLKTSGLTDITIAFRLHNEIPDLGGRDRIHMLLRAQ